MMIRVPRSARAVRWFLSILAIALASSRAEAQPVMAGVARDANLGKPLQCLHVALIDSTGRSVAHTVTDSAGEFMLEAPRAGPYSVQFIVQGWERLGGPVDTLTESDFRQRVYPLAFTNMLVRDPSRGPVPIVNRGAGESKKDADVDSVPALETDGTWQSHRVIPGPGLRYPERRYAARASGIVLAQFIIDSTGKAREDSWRLIRTSHADFETAVRDSLANARWRPARIAGKPVCELVLDYTEFSIEGNVGRIVLRTR